jgi:hypothetical protein
MSALETLSDLFSVDVDGPIDYGICAAATECENKNGSSLTNHSFNYDANGKRYAKFKCAYCLGAIHSCCIFTHHTGTDAYICKKCGSETMVMKKKSEPPLKSKTYSSKTKSNKVIFANTETAEESKLTPPPTLEKKDTSLKKTE